MSRHLPRREKADRFVLKDERGMRALPFWLKERTYNSWGSDAKDKFGNPLIGLSYDPKPHKYWSGFEDVGLILITNHELFERAEELVHQHCED